MKLLTTEWWDGKLQIQNNNNHNKKSKYSKEPANIIILHYVLKVKQLI